MWPAGVVIMIHTPHLACHLLSFCFSSCFYFLLLLQLLFRLRSIELWIFFSLSLQTAMNPPASPYPAHNERSNTNDEPRPNLFPSIWGPAYLNPTVKYSFLCVTDVLTLRFPWLPATTVSPISLLPSRTRSFPAAVCATGKKDTKHAKHWVFQSDPSGHDHHVIYCFMGDWTALKF